VSNEDLFGFAPEQLKAVRNEIYFLYKSLGEDERRLIEALKGLTMLPPTRLLDAARSAKQAAKRNPCGSVVEFGVYRGGAIGAMAYGVSIGSVFDGGLIGFDTFEGHTRPPRVNELDIHGRVQRKIYEEKLSTGESWASCDMGTVRENYLRMADKIGIEFPELSLVKGDACETAQELNKLCRNGISLLR
jgi:hypothetical protein